MRSRRNAIVRGAIALTMLALGAAGLPVGASSQSAPGVTVDRTFLPTVVPPGYLAQSGPYAQHLALSPVTAAGVLYGIDELSPGYVSAYGLTTMRPLSRQGLRLDGTVSTYTQLPGRQGLLIAVSAAGQEQPTTELEQVAWSAGRLRVVSKLPTPTSAFGPAQIVVGLARDPGSNQFFVLSASSVEASYVPGSVQLSLVQLAGRGAPARVVWRQSLPDCQLPMASGRPGPVQLPAPLGVMHSRLELVVGCSAQGSGGIYKPPTAIGVGVVRLAGRAHPSYGGFQLFPYPGDATANSEGIWFPREDRLAFQIRDSSSASSAWALFDADHDAYVGTIPISVNADEAGADLVHGRLYLLNSVSNDGLRTADVGPTPADQGHAYPQYSKDRINEDQDYGVSPRPWPLVTDPAHHRLFVLYVGSHRFVVLRDSVSYYTSPAPADPDQNTTDIPEKRGVTAANWSGSAQGFGSVIRQVGGASSLQYNVVPFVVNQGQSGTQQLATSYLDTMQLTGGDARASAVTAAPDNGPTTATLGQAGLQWPYHPAVCDDSGATKTATVDNAEVACDSAAGSVKASVVGGAAGAGSTAKAADLVVSSTALTARSTSAQGQGMTTTVSSVARGVSVLGGVLQIGHIAATAVAHAGGRPGTAHTSYSRTLSNVVLLGQQLCAHSCDPKDLASRINDALAGRVAVTFPEPDRQLAAGSAGGYQALVRRDIFAETEETQLNEQDPNRVEVPAMQLTIFEDNTVKSRTVVYLAGVEAEAHYGIYRLSCATCSPRATTKAQPTNQAAKAPATGSGPATPVTTQTGATASPQVAAQPTTVGGLLRHGWQLLTNGIGAVVRLFGVWLLLLAPVYVSARRWLLLSRHRQAK